MELDKSEKPYVVCMRVDATKPEMVHPESIRTKCVLCRCDIYVMPHNKDYNSICVSCLPEIEDAHDEEAEMIVNPIDIVKAQEFIDKMKSGG